MKFLITNYHSESQTECLYFNTALNLIKGCSSTIWDPRQTSAYDILDLTKPDYLLTHIASIYEDALRYISENGGCKLIVNVTSSSRDDVEKIEKILLEQNIDIAFFYTNDDETYKLKRTNLVSIPLGADIFLYQNSIRYSIKKAFVVNNKSEIVECEEPHHILSYNNKLVNSVDIAMPENKLAGLYRNYDEIVLKFCGKLIPQIFFDATYYGNKVYYDLADTEQLSMINNKISKILKTDVSLKDNNDIDSIKNIIKRKHTCLNRVKSLLSQLPSNDIINNVNDIMKVYIGDVT